MRRVGLDPGQRRTGVALCEEGLSVAVPVRTVEHGSFAEAVARVGEVLVELAPSEVVIGLPLRLDGTEGVAAKQSRRFAGALQAAHGLAIVLWDERLTTVAAERALSEQGVAGRARRKVVDQAAATIVLQSYLDAQSNDGDVCRDDPTDHPQMGGAQMPQMPAFDPGPGNGRGRQGRQGQRGRQGRAGRDTRGRRRGGKP